MHALARRAAEVTWVSTRYLLPLGVRHVTRRPPPTRDVARGLRRTFEQLAGVYAKFGQLLGSAPGIFGPELASEFRGFLDRGPTVSIAHVVSTLEREWRRDLHEVLTYIDPRPVGSASLAVVHRATRTNGEDVAVKVLRPGIESDVALDVGLLQPLTSLLARRFGVGAAEPAVRLLDGLSQQLSAELDLRLEARTMSEAHRSLEERPNGRLNVPRVHHDLSTRRVLVTDYVNGLPVDDARTLLDAGIDPAGLMEDLLRWWFTCALNETFHADLHAGNLLVDPEGRLHIVDWGIVGRLDDFSNEFFRRMLQAALGDEDAWSDVLATLLVIWEKPPGMTDEELAAMLRAMITSVFTSPFGEVDLTALIIVPDRRSGQETAVRDDHQDWASGTGTEFERHLTLLVKQLIYFERYGKLYLPERSLLADRAFFADLLATPE